MSLQRLALLCAASICLSALADAPVREGRESADLELVTRVRLAAERIEYRGIITAEANAAVFDLYAKTNPRPRMLLIESPGGSAGPAMELGWWMLEHGVDVEVDAYCFSSCANYVFVAGRNKILSSSASLMWHGGVTQPISKAQIEQVLDVTLADLSSDEKSRLLERYSREELLQQLEDARLDLIQRETRFFRALGIDQRITSLGHLYERELLRGKGNYAGWDYSLEDLARLGVRGVQVRGDQWTPQWPIAGQRILRIHLDDLPGFVVDAAH